MGKQYRMTGETGKFDLAGKASTEVRRGDDEGVVFLEDETEIQELACGIAGKEAQAMADKVYERVFRKTRRTINSLTLEDETRDAVAGRFAEKAAIDVWEKAFGKAYERAYDEIDRYGIGWPE